MMHAACALASIVPSAQGRASTRSLKPLRELVGLHAGALAQRIAVAASLGTVFASCSVAHCWKCDTATRAASWRQGAAVVEEADRLRPARASARARARSAAPSEAG